MSKSNGGITLRHEYSGQSHVYVGNEYAGTVRRDDSGRASFNPGLTSRIVLQPEQIKAAEKASWEAWRKKA